MLSFAIAADHAGFPLKAPLVNLLRQLGHTVVDLGPQQPDPEDDYPDSAAAVARAVQSGQVQRGIVLCGSGVGATVAANKFKGVRACLCHDIYSAAQGVEHDDMNVLCLGGRIIGPSLAEALVKGFAGAAFSAAPRHLRRLKKVQALDEAAHP